MSTQDCSPVARIGGHESGKKSPKEPKRESVSDFISGRIGKCFESILGTIFINYSFTFFIIYREQEIKQMAKYCSSFMNVINTALNISALHLSTT